MKIIQIKLIYSFIIDMNIFELCALIVSFLYIFYDTDFAPYYLKLFKFKWFKVEEYFKFIQTSPIKLNYFECLCMGKHSFWLTLLACPICLSVWLVFLLNLACNLQWSDFGYKVIMTWVGYSALRFIMKKLYE